MQDFQKLLVWHRAHRLSLVIDGVARRFPRQTSSSIKSQLTRAVDAIASNVVEGSGAASQREFARFLDIAIKSSSETQHHLISVRDRKILARAVADKLIDEVVQIRRMLYALRKSVLRDLS